MRRLALLALLFFAPLSFALAQGGHENRHASSQPSSIEVSVAATPDPPAAGAETRLVVTVRDFTSDPPADLEVAHERLVHFLLGAAAHVASFSGNAATLAHLHGETAGPKGAIPVTRGTGVRR